MVNRFALSAAVLLSVLGIGCGGPSPTAQNPAPAVESSPKWQTFTPEAGRFRVEMPGSPTSEVRNELVRGGATVTIRTFAVEVKDGAFLLSYFDLPRGGVYNHGTGVEGALKRLNGKAVKEEVFSFGDGFAKQVEAEVANPKGRCVLRSFSVQGRVFQQMVLGPEVRASSEDVRRFFNSFQPEK